MVLLALMVAASYPFVVLGLETFYYRDYGVLAYPTIHFHRECFWQGQVPLWNPLSHCGVPFLAQWGTMVLYPPSLIYLLLPLPWSLSVFCLGHLWFGGMGMFLLLTRWTHDQFAAAFGAIAYSFSGVVLSSLMWPNWTAALGLLPWVVYSGERASQKGGRWIIHAAFLGAFQMLTGVPEVIVMTWLIVALLWVRATLNQPGTLLKLLGRGCIIVALVSLLSAAQLLPFMDLVAHSHRQHGFSDIRWAMPGWGWANLLVPLFHCFQTPQGNFAQHEQAFFTSYYSGWLVLVLGVAGCSRMRTHPHRVAFLLLLIGLILSLGPNGYLHTLLRSLIPGLGLGRFPVKFFVLGSFALSVLAAYAIASLLSNLESQRLNWNTVWLCVGVASGLSLFVLWFGRTYPFPFDQWPVAERNFIVRLILVVISLGCLWMLSISRSIQRTRLLCVALLIVHWLDLRFHWPAQNPTLPSAALSASIAEQGRELGSSASRIFIAPWAGQRLLYSQVQDPSQDLLGKRLAMWSNLNLLEGVLNVGGAMTLRLRHQEDIHNRLQLAEEAELNSWLDYLAVSHTTATNNPVQWELRAGFANWITAGHQTQLSTGPTLEEVSAPGFDPSTILLLPADVAPFPPHVNTGAYQLEIEHATTQSFIIESQAEQPLVLSIAQSYHPNWRASVNGAPADVWRANHAFQAIAVPAGSSVIKVYYTDTRLLWAGLSSLLIVTICCGFQCLRGLKSPTIGRRSVKVRSC